MEVPDYLTRWPGLSVREGDRIVPAAAADSEVARGYPLWPDKGTPRDGILLTLLTRKTVYAAGEDVRILHVVEVAVPGRSVYVMGPKPIQGEYVDGKLATAAPPPQEDQLAPAEPYDGPVLASPAVDYNYDITTYTFATPGTHTIYWQLGSARSNTLTIQVVPRPVIETAG